MSLSFVIFQIECCQKRSKLIRLSYLVVWFDPSPNVKVEFQTTKTLEILAWKSSKKVGLLNFLSESVYYSKPFLFLRKCLLALSVFYYFFFSFVYMLAAGSNRRTDLEKKYFAKKHNFRFQDRNMNYFIIRTW